MTRGETSSGTPAHEAEIIRAFCHFNVGPMSAEETRIWETCHDEMIADARGLDLSDEQVRAEAEATADRELAFWAGVRWAEQRLLQVQAGGKPA